jgi:peptidoglycan/xylan/chitin deacetylase (PgdA/CDA1 family)
MRAILTYHSLDDSGSVISVPPAAFRRHVAWFSAAGVRLVTVPELLALDDDVHAAALTFDDGFANFATHAAPVLREHGAPATVFVVSDHVGTDNRWRGRGDAGIPVLPLLDWHALGALRESGIALAAHTRTHPALPALSHAAVEDELVSSADAMQRELGERPTGFAYPYGAVSRDVATLVARMYAWACTTEFRMVSTFAAPRELPRLDAWYFRDGGMLERWGTSAFRAWVWARRQARGVRRLGRGPLSGPPGGGPGSRGARRCRQWPCP